jgi:hypothetical protein
MNWSAIALAAPSTDDFENLKQRVEELEQSLSTLSSESAQKDRPIQSFFTQSLALGGFFENSLTGIWGKNTPTQVVADSHRLGINLGADWNPNLRLVSQYTLGFTYPLRNEHNNPLHGSSTLPTLRQYEAITYGALLSQAFVEYSHSDQLRLQAGMGYVPYGQAFQVREPVFFFKRKGPQLIRTSGVTRVIIADPFWEGLNLLWQPNSRWQMNLYTNTSLNHSGKLGGGTRIARVGDQYTLGVSYQTGGQADEYYQSFGADAKWEGRYLGIQAEYGRNSTPNGSPESFYVQPYILISEKRGIIFIEADYLKNPLGETILGSTAVDDPYIKWEHSVGFVYKFLAQVRGRFDFTWHDYVGDRARIIDQERDYYSVTLSSGVTF